MVTRSETSADVVWVRERSRLNVLGDNGPTPQRVGGSSRNSNFWSIVEGVNVSG